MVWTDQRNGYGFGYWLIVGLDVAFALGAIVVLAVKCRMRSIRKRCTLPLVLMGLLLLYMALYLLRVPFIRVFARDMACVFCLSFVAIAESCIQCRLIPSNTGYEELFDASVDVSAQIVDRDYSVRYAARSAEKIPAEQMRQAESAPVVLTGGKCLHNAPIAGGHVIWTEDRSALLRVRDELEQTQEELQEIA